MLDVMAGAREKIGSHIIEIMSFTIADKTVYVGHLGCVFSEI